MSSKLNREQWSACAWGCQEKRGWIPLGNNSTSPESSYENTSVLKEWWGGIAVAGWNILAIPSSADKVLCLRSKVFKQPVRNSLYPLHVIGVTALWGWELNACPVTQLLVSISAQPVTILEPALLRLWLHNRFLGSEPAILTCDLLLESIEIPCGYCSLCRGE